MKKNYAVLSRMLALTLTITLLLTSCSNTPSKSTNSSTPSVGTESTEVSKVEDKNAEPVTLEWYTNVNAVMPDVDMMTNEAQRYIKEKTNATVNFHLYNWGDYATTVNTMISSGANMDIVFAGGGVDYVSNSQRNAFIAIDDYMDEYLPKTKESLPEAAWKSVTINGKIYGIPAQKDLGERMNVEVNKTMMDDLGIQFPKETYSTALDLVDWLYSVKKARDAKYPEKSKIPLLSSTNIGDMQILDPMCSMVYTNISKFPGCKGQGEGETAFNYFKTDEYRSSMKLIRQLVVDGILPFEDNFDPDQVHKQAGDLLGWIGSGLLTIDENINDPYYKTSLYVSNITKLTTASATVGPQAISSTCKTPERALSVLELVNSDQYLATTLRYGVEGEHWTDTDNDNIIENGKRNADPASRGWYTWYGWQFGGLFVTKVPEGNPSNFGELMSDFNKAAPENANLGFVVDQTNITNEMAACANVIAEYNATLAKGQNDNVDELVDQFIKKLDANGAQNVVDEVQTQLTAWRKSVGKSVK